MATFSWHTITANAYEDDRWNFVVLVEESGDPSEAPYLDSAFLPTIGVGFNLNMSEAIQ